VVLGSILNDGDEVFTVEDAGDGDKGTGMGQIRDKLELGITELGDSAIEFSQAIGSSTGLLDDNHRAKVARHFLSSEVRLDG
jgi:hypothetical protein